jgi:hypothetical protein
VIIRKKTHMTHPGDKAAAVVDRLRAAAQTDEGDAYDVCNLAAAEIERLTADNERLRYALMTIRDDLSSVTVTGEELHNIVGGINDVLDQQLIPKES